MYKSILVPLDSSPYSMSALPVAAALARRTGAVLHLATVYDPTMFLHFSPGITTMPPFDQSSVDARCRELSAWIEEQAASVANTGIAATGTMLEGMVVEALAEQANAVSADLVVMASRGREGLDRLRLGSVAASFIVRSPAPVFLIRPDGTDFGGPGRDLPAGTLLVPLDGSPFSESILLPAATFAEAAGLAIELVIVVVQADAGVSLLGAETSAVDDSIDRGRQGAAREYLERMAQRIVPRPARAPALTVPTEARAAQAIVDYAHRTAAGVVGMATHGRSGLLRMVLGSVADKVLQRVEQPALIYRPDDAAVLSSRGTAAS